MRCRPTKGQGPSTPSQTAWGLIGLLAGADLHEPAIVKAVFLPCAPAEGRWLPGANRISPARVFPGVFYLKYHLYRNSFPVLCAGRATPTNRAGADEYLALKFQPSQFRLR